MGKGENDDHGAREGAWTVSRKLELRKKKSLRRRVFLQA